MPQDNHYKSILAEKIEERTARVGVVGLGYVGLPLALEFVHAGFSVVAIDVDARKVEALAKGESYIKDIKAEDVQAAIKSGKLHPTTDVYCAEGVLEQLHHLGGAGG